ncbi:MAG: Lacal_2735 family protein [Flavobacteriaceae bacterium]|nr:Lacal_2735 family protein [Flavobacteriaceae bacterium]
MNPHFNNIDQAREKINAMLNVNELEQRYKTTIEQAYNLSQTESGLSDALYYEASLMLQRILKLKASFDYNFEAA